MIVPSHLLGKYVLQLGNVHDVFLNLLHLLGDALEEVVDVHVLRFEQLHILGTEGIFIVGLLLFLQLLVQSHLGGRVV